MSNKYKAAFEIAPDIHPGRTVNRDIRPPRCTTPRACLSHMRIFNPRLENHVQHIAESIIYRVACLCLHMPSPWDWLAGGIYSYRYFVPTGQAPDARDKLWDARVECFGKFN